jgi:hypothetical protein
MKPIGVEELKDLTEYERIRPEARNRIIDLKNRRRIQAGEKISIVFENRETVLYQIQEMVRAERIVSPEGIAHEMETYNAILPKDGSLAGTLFIEIRDSTNIRADLDAFIGLDRGEHVWFDLGPAGRVVGRFAEGQSEEGRITSVHYLQFPFSPSAIKVFCDLGRPVTLVVEHAGYRASASVDGSTRRSLAEDLSC